MLVVDLLGKVSPRDTSLFKNGGLISHQNEAASDSITEAPKSIGWSKYGVISGAVPPNRVCIYIYIYINMI